MLGKFTGLRCGGLVEPAALLRPVPDEGLLAAARSVAGLSSVSMLETPGSSGAFFSGFRDDRRRFMKTHRVQAASCNILKEFGLLSRLYGDVMCPLIHRVGRDGGCQNFLEMAYIEHNAPECLEPGRMVSMTSDLAARLGPPCAVDLNYSARDLHALAFPALEELSAVNLIEPDVARACEDSARRFADYADSDPVVCHGDLGNENIRCRGDDLIVVDWEDSMYGPRHYDMLYWLTFIAQRRYYSALLLPEIGVPRQYGVDVMVVVVLLKSYLAFLNKRHLGFRLSVSDRIREILAIL